MNHSKTDFYDKGHHKLNRGEVDNFILQPTLVHNNIMERSNLY